LQISVDDYFLKKSAGEPGLEVADFIMHAVHGMARARLEGRDGYDRLISRPRFTPSWNVKSASC
jgi:hypothetical protein